MGRESRDARAVTRLTLDAAACYGRAAWNQRSERVSIPAVPDSRESVPRPFCDARGSLPWRARPVPTLAISMLLDPSEARGVLDNAVSPRPGVCHSSGMFAQGRGS
jgi:hypothetical protein